ncbi:MAG: hypothetical protein JW904_12170 [Spirochaetales bacterium]|nr:hypothetical protein [Spirochaetales bacterium]
MNHETTHSRPSAFLSLREFAGEFSHVTAHSQKASLLKAYFDEHPKAKLAAVVDALSSLEDRQICIEEGSKALASLTFFERIGLSGRLAAIDRDISRMAREAARKILSRDRNGKQFPEIVMGNLVPMVKQNEGTALLRTAEQLSGLRDSHPVKRVHAAFIFNCAHSIAIAEKIKSLGVSDETIKSVFNENKKLLSRRSMRKVIQSYLLLDPRFKNHLKPMEELLNALLDEAGAQDEHDSSIEAGRKELAELAGVRDLGTFLSKSAAFTEAGGAYIDEVAGLFDLLLNAPLVNILKLIKFPLNRQLFKKWMHDAPIPNGMSDELDRTIISVEQDLEKKGQDIHLPRDFDGQLRLVYAYNIGFTDKYKLCVETAKQIPEANAVYQYVCRQIKEVQFKIENKFLETVLVQLRKSFSFSEIDIMLENDAKKIQARIADFTVHFKKNIDELVAKPGGKRYSLLHSVVKHIAEEKMISPEAFIEINKKINPAMDLAFAGKLSSSLIDYYFLLNAKLTLEFLKNYFLQIRKSDGVCLSKKLSTMTREDVYGFMSQYKNEPAAVKRELEKYLSWGAAERRLRGQFVSRLGAGEFVAPEIQAGKYRLEARRYGNTFVLKILDRESSTRFNKNVTGIATFLDFKNAVHRFKIDKYVPAGEDVLKILFQYCHIDACRTIEEYIRERHELMTFADSLLLKSSQAIKSEISEAVNSEDKVDYFIERGTEELSLRRKLVSKMESEASGVIKDSAQAGRLQKEIGLEKTTIERLEAMIRFVEAFGKKKSDPAKLDIKEIDSFLRTHRLAQNNEYIADKKRSCEKVIESEESVPASLAKALEYLNTMPDIQPLKIPDPVVSDEVTVDIVMNAVRDYILFHAVEDNITFFEQLLHQCSKEKELRSEFIGNHEKDRGRNADLVKTELAYQRTALSQLQEIEEIVGKEIAQFREVEKLNSEADAELEKIIAAGSTQDDTARSEAAQKALSAVGDETIRMTAASKLLMAADSESVEDWTVRALEKSSIDRFKILASLYRVLDAQQDYEVKIKLIDDFIAYLAENKKEIFHALKSLLDIQRERIAAEYENRKIKISDMWKMINGNETREGKMSCINELLKNPQMRLYWPYCAQIRDGLLTENIGEFLGRNTALPVSEQLELIQKIQLFGSDAYNIPAVAQMFSFKEMELQARQKIYQPETKAVFSKNTFLLLEKSRENKSGVCNAMDNDAYDRECRSVEEKFRAHGIEDSKIKSYIKKNLSSPKAVSHFSSVTKRQKTPPVESAIKTERMTTQQAESAAMPKIRKDTAEPKDKKAPESDASQKEPHKTEQEKNQQQEAKTTAASTKEKKEPKQQLSFEEALMKLGADIEEDEKKIVRRAELLIQDARAEEAASLIQEEAGKMAGEGRHRDMAKFLSVCTWNDVISKNKKVRETVQSTLLEKKSEIIAAAEKQIPPPAEPAAQPEPHHVKEGGMAGLLHALETQPDCTTIDAFGTAYGFSGEEMPRLKKIIPELAKQGSFVYVPDRGLVLGKGMLKPLIHRLFDELMNTKTVGIDPRILKAAWDHIRSSMAFDQQLVMLGVSSKEERTELLRELEQLLNPRDMFKKADPRKKAAASLRAQKKSAESPQEEKPGEHPSPSGKDRSEDRKNGQISRSREPRRESFFGSKKGKAPASKKTEKQKVQKYSEVARKYISQSYAPLISSYIKRMYKQKSDFFIPFEGKKQYYTREVLRHAIEGILRKDISGNHHLDLLDSIRRDKELFPLIISELFEPHTVDGQTVYFPRFIKGKVQL